MILPWNSDASARRRPSSSASSSSSVHCVSGFLAPPWSVFFVTRRTTVSSIFVLAAPPGGLSKYCLTRRAEKPLVPPKYSMSRSSSSAECGMLWPPVWAARRKLLTAPTSTSLRYWAFFLLRLPALMARRHIRHLVSRRPSFLRLKLSWLFGSCCPHSLHTFHASSVIFDPAAAPFGSSAACRPGGSKPGQEKPPGLGLWRPVSRRSGRAS